MTQTYIDNFTPTLVEAEDLPWIPFTPYSTEVFLKVLHVDYVHGEVFTMMKLPPNSGLGVHNHYGRVFVYTVQGTWSYDEHDWVSKPGDFLYEVADSRHTVTTHPGEEVILFVYMEGSNAFLDDEGGFLGIETAHTIAERYEAFCRDNNLPIVNLTEFSIK